MLNIALKSFGALKMSDKTSYVICKFKLKSKTNFLFNFWYTRVRHKLHTKLFNLWLLKVCILLSHADSVWVRRTTTTLYSYLFNFMCNLCFKLRWTMTSNIRIIILIRIPAAKAHNADAKWLISTGATSNSLTSHLGRTPYHLCFW